MVFEWIQKKGAQVFGQLNPTQDSQVEYLKPYLPSGRRLYCIGDIHGRLDLLQELHQLIMADIAEYEGSKGLVYLGDYIDRGAQSREVIDLLVKHPMEGFELTFLRGNHEQAMLDFLEHPRAAAAWLDFGGHLTLMSYGAGLGSIHLRRQVEVLRDELEMKLPPEHLDFLFSCRLSHHEGHYGFVHAGVRPGIPFEQQSAEDLMWIRDDFIKSREDHGCIIVHGHSISEDVDWRPNRIGIDTGAYYSGTLTALVLEDDQQRLLQTGKAD